MQSTTNATVLIVDDDPVMIKLLSAGLEKSDKHYTIDTAKNGEEALRKVKERFYSLVITDYKMPGISGITLVQKIDQIAPETRVILMSGYGSDVLKRDVIDSLKVEAYLDKPISINEIRKIVENIFLEIQQPKVSPPKMQPDLQYTISERLNYFRSDVGAECVLLLSKSGHLIDKAGDVKTHDISGISALVVANFMAGIELARMLGNNSVFKTSYHEGPNHNIYAHDIDGNFMLATICGLKSKQGMVRFYTGKLIEELKPILANEVLPSMESLDEEFSQTLAEDLNSLFLG